MIQTMVQKRTREIHDVSLGDVAFAALLAEGTPVILKNAVTHWPLVAAGADGPAAAMAYLRRFDGGVPVVAYTGPPEIKGRFHYNADVTAMNFTAARAPLDAVLSNIADAIGQSDAPAFYIGSTDVNRFLPGLRAENDLPLDEAMFRANPPIVSAWIGNRTTAAAHFDYSNNIACNAVGRRRFTLFPPDQIANLYPGPLEPTPGGQVVTMVDLANPDLARYPRFAEALAAAEVAELHPGDVLFYPAMWWHQVDALAEFNVMVNYWWNTTPAFIDTPMTTLQHAMLSLRDRPDHEKAAWRALFDYYVFGDAEQAATHLPEHITGPLAPMTEMTARRLRAQLLSKMNR